MNHIKSMILVLMLLAGTAFSAEVHVTLSSRMTGSHTFSDGTVIEQWGFREGGGMMGQPQVPGPIITANEGDRVFIHFQNMSPMPHTIHPHGLDADQQNDGVPQTSFEIPMMGSYIYEFDANHAGSYAYHCHVNTVIHLQMGMYGAINILPPNGSNHAWDGGPAFDFERTWLTAEIDLVWNQLGEDADFTNYEPDLFVLNGLDGPQAASDAYTRVDLLDDDVALLRLGNMGYLPVRYSFTGLYAEAVASDGRPLPERISGQGLVVAPGERYDVMLRGLTSGNFLAELDYLDLYDSSVLGQLTLPVTVTGDPSDVWPEDDLDQFRVSIPSPMPFHSSVSFTMGMPSRGMVDVWVHDIRGRLIKQEQVEMDDGSAYTWNGRDDNGSTLASGVYYLRFRHRGKYETHKVTLLR